MAVTAYLLPGPSAAHPEMGRSLYNAIAPVRTQVDGIDKFFKEKKMDYKATKACFVDSAEKLRFSSYGGPALLSLCWGTVQALREKHVMPSMVGGAGFGEISAMVVARILDFHDAIMYTMGRGEILEEAFAKAPFHVLTITGIPVEKLEIIVSALSPKPLTVGYHSPDACTLAGTKAVLKKLSLALKKLKGFKIRMGEVVPGMDWPHPIFDEASKKVEGLFSELKLERAGTVEFFSSASGEWLRDHNTLPELARRGCVEPIRFHSMIKAMRARGMDTVVEIGPGAALGAYTHAHDAGIRVLGTDGTKEFSASSKLAN